MISIVNIKQYEQKLRDYINSGDFTHPFIVAGWSRIGKSAIANKLKTQYPNIEIKKYHMEGENNDFLRRLQQNCNSTSGSPQIICITTGTDMRDVRTIANLGCNIHFLEFDMDLWEEWAREKNETTGMQNVDDLFLEFLNLHPENIHENIREQKNIQQKLEQKVNDFCSYDGTDAETLLDILKFIFIGQQILYIRKKDIDPQWERIMTYLTENRSKFSVQDQAKIQQVLMILGPKLNQLYF